MSFYGFSIVDIVFAVLVLLYLLNGLRRGLCRELAQIITLAAVLAAFYFFYPQIRLFAERHVSFIAPEHMHIAVPAMVLLAAVILYYLLRIGLRILFCPFLDFFGEKLLGGVVGAARGVVIGALILSALTLVPNAAVQEAVVDKSFTGCIVENMITPWLRENVMNPPARNEKTETPPSAPAPTTSTNAAVGVETSSTNQQSEIGNRQFP